MKLSDIPRWASRERSTAGLGLLSAVSFLLCWGGPTLPAERPSPPTQLARPAQKSAEDRQSHEHAAFLPEKPLSVREAIILALHRNPDVEIAIARIQQAEAAQREAWAAFSPVVSADTSIIRGDAPSMFFGKKSDSRQLDMARTDFNNPGTFTNFETGGQIQLNLFNGGRDWLATRIAREQLALNKLNRRAVENELVFAVIQGYYDVLAAKEMVTTTAASGVAVEAQLIETRSKFRHGGALKSDVLSLEVRLSQAKEQHIMAENAYRLSRVALANLLGLDPGTSFDLSGEEWKPREIPTEYEDGLAAALATRPELEQARRRVAQSKLALASEQGGYIPRLDAIGRTYWDDRDARYESHDTNWFVGTQLTWNLFEGGRTSARVSKAKASLRESIAADRKVTLAIQLDVCQAYLRLEEARNRVEVTEKAVAQAEEALELVRKQFEGGSATVTRYLEAESHLTQARSNAIRARFDLKKAMANVARALGWCEECARAETSSHR